MIRFTLRLHLLTLTAIIYLPTGDLVAATIPNTALTPSVWLKADAITGIADAGDVATWADASGNGRNATQGTALRRPTYRADGIAAGVPSVRFNTNGDATNEFLAFPMAISNTANAALTMFVVAADSGQRSSATSRAILVNTRPNGTSATGLGLGFAATSSPNTEIYAHYGRATATASTLQSAALPMPNSGPTLLTLVRDGSDSTLRGFTDGGYSTESTTWTGYATSALTTTQIATEGGSHYFFGDIAEIVIFESALSQGDLVAVANYLGDKYSIASASAIPEPSSIALLSLAPFAFIRRKFA
ncbi:MAG: hypothetical protein H0T51_20035 [Pirellulales bacterium]|nr:hypothetical protein [Pirellulales bacterium]